VDGVLNWVAQGATVAVAATLLLASSPGMRAASRYAVWWVALLLVAALPLISALSRLDAPDAGSGAGAFARPSHTLVHIPEGPRGAGAGLIAAWALWIAVAGGRAWAGFVSLRRAKRACRPFPADREARLHRWMAVTLRGRRAELVTSDDVPLAAVLGFGVPAIAVAPALLDALDDDELDSIVLHEWAHVQQRDDYAALGQLLVRVAVGWHPALWWIGRQLHLEREVACDERTVGITRSPKAYAACLATLAALRSAPGMPRLPAPAVHARSELARRIHRVLGFRRVQSVSRSAVVAMLSSSLVMAVAWSAGRVAVFAPRTLAALPPTDLETAHVLPLSRPEQTADIVLMGELPRPADRGPLRRIARGEPAQAPRAGVDRRSDPATPPASNSLPPSIAGDVQPAWAEHGPSRVDAIRAQPLSIVAELSSSGVEPGGEVTVPDLRRNVTAWGAAADAGVTIGRGSEKAAVATAGFFTRVGRKVAGSF
jgi:beta-lactamase regulating signal transducer with metallopeptidase domain